MKRHIGALALGTLALLALACQPAQQPEAAPAPAAPAQAPEVAAPAPETTAAPSAQEVDQRSKAGQHHGAGSTNIAKVVLARRIGISRTKERPAPTPSTATKFGS